MSDPMAGLEPETREKAKALIIACQRTGMRIAVGSGLRTYVEQDALYAQGRTAPGPVVTKARGGQSWHNLGRAFDVGFVTTFTGKLDYSDGRPWAQIGKLGEVLGLIWGGRWRSFPDLDHFEWRGDPPLDIGTARDLYERDHPAELAARHPTVTDETDEDQLPEDFV